MDLISFFVILVLVLLRKGIQISINQMIMKDYLTLKTMRGILYSSFGFVMSAAVGQAEVTMNWANIGDAGNVADSSSGYGAVDYNYKISKREVTIGQYAEFLNSVAATDSYALYNPNMGSNGEIAGIARSGSSGSYSYTAMAGSSNRPITYVSWFDSARFVNWIENGQGAGDTETGVYALNGATSGVGFTANANATHRIPTEDEWYKAAYYDPSKGEVSDADNYWLHAMQSDTLVDNSTSANYNDGDYASSPNRLTNVGAYAGQLSHYGTFDQGGNVWEWNDTITGASLGLRGGAWLNGETDLSSAVRTFADPSGEGSFAGFRIAIVSVPEPSSMALLSLGSLSLLLRRRRG